MEPSTASGSTPIGNAGTSPASQAVGAQGGGTASAAPALAGTWRGTCTFKDNPAISLKFSVGTDGRVSGSLTQGNTVINVTGAVQGRDISMKGEYGTGKEKMTVALTGQISGSSARGQASAAANIDLDSIAKQTAEALTGALSLGAAGSSEKPGQQSPGAGKPGAPQKPPEITKGNWQASKT